MCLSDPKDETSLVHFTLPFFSPLSIHASFQSRWGRVKKIWPIKQLHHCNERHYFHIEKSSSIFSQSDHSVFVSRSAFLVIAHFGHLKESPKPTEATIEIPTSCFRDTSPTNYFATRHSILLQLKRVCTLINKTSLKVDSRQVSLCNASMFETGPCVWTKSKMNSQQFLPNFCDIFMRNITLA